jgi:coenzyme F420-reducing hydrogenase alpha subunit
MSRHPLIADLASCSDRSAREKLLIAMLLDSLAIADALASYADGPGDTQRSLSPQHGVGMAYTARGPVFHSIRLAADERVEDWKLLAPTDWHLAHRGLLHQLLRASNGNNDVDVCAVDPCAPWRIQRMEETAHA